MKRWVWIGMLAAALLLPVAVLGAPEAESAAAGMIEVPGEMAQRMEEADAAFDFQKAVEEAQGGETSFGAAWLLQRVGSVFWKEVRGSLRVVAALIVIGVLFSLVTSLHPDDKNALTGAAYYVCLLVLFGLIGAAFFTALQEARAVVESLCVFLKSMLMVLFTYLATAGSYVSAGVFSSTFLVLTQILSDLVLNVVVPLSVITLAFSFINALYEKPVLSSLIKLLQASTKYLLSFMFIVFLGMAGLQGALSATFEGMAAKGAKFAVKSVPVVGGLLSDSADVVLSSSVLIKNSVGTVGIIALVVAVLVPVCRLLSTALVLKVGGALLEVVAGEKFSRCLRQSAGAILMLLGCVLCVFVFSVAAVGVVIATGNAAMMR